MNIFCTSLNFRNCNSETREKFSLQGNSAKSLCTEIKNEFPFIKEIVPLCTCNRTELYAAFPGDKKTPDIKGAILKFFNIPQDTVIEFDTHENKAAIAHLFKVICGLDSMVIGESEISSQIKSSYSNAKAEGFTGKIFNVLFQRAFSLSKDIRNQTSIGQYRVSVASIAIDEALKRMDSKNINATIWGTGPVGRAAVKTLKKNNIKGGYVISRDKHKAELLAEDWGGASLTPNELTSALQNCNLFISCTGAPHYVLQKKHFDEINQTKKMLILDLAIPRDVEKEIGECSNIELVDLDTLSKVSQKGYEQRLKAREEIIPIIECEAQTTWICLNASLAGSCLADWKANAGKVLSQEIETVLKHHSQQDVPLKEAMTELGERLLTRIMRWPSQAITSAIREGLPCANVAGEIYPHCEGICPSIQPESDNVSAFHPISLNMSGTTCTIFGGGKTALKRTKTMLEAGAVVKIISPETNSGILKLKERYKSQLIIYKKAFSPSDMDSSIVIIAATNNKNLNKRIASLAKMEGKLVNCTSEHTEGNIIFPAVSDKGGVTIAVQTNGASPALSKRLAENMSATLPDNISDYTKALKQFRQLIKDSDLSGEQKQNILKKVSSEEFQGLCEKMNYTQIIEEMKTSHLSACPRKNS